ncbi:MAG: phosphatase PAP2 family protein [Flavobacteriales bacterium]|nr:phosphatase PAP2 family protein [Flavobacteriales bacterium]
MEERKAVRLFMAGHLVLALPVTWAVLTTGRLELHAAVNDGTLAFADDFFRVITHVGDGLVPVVLAVLLFLFKGVRAFLMMGVGCGLGAIVVQALKRLVFSDVYRPSRFMAEMPDMHWVPGIELHGHLSFPSGHTTAAFGMCFALVVVLRRRAWALPLLVLAALVGLSRVHLSQHFTEDVVAGSVIGTGTAYLVYRLLYADGLPAWVRRGPMGRRAEGRA